MELERGREVGEARGRLESEGEGQSIGAGRRTEEERVKSESLKWLV